MTEALLRPLRRVHAGLQQTEQVYMVLVAVLIGMERRARKRDPAARVYDRFCSALARQGLVRAPHEGPIDFARRAVRERPQWRDAVDRITSAYVAARYAGDEVDLRTLERTCRGAIRECRP